MQTRRWTNPSQPQTLQTAVILLYINAAFSLLFGTYAFFADQLARWLTPWLAEWAGLGLVVGMGVAGFAIANERKWGYRLGVAVTVADLALVLVAIGDLSNLLRASNFIAVLFAVARAALLLHPMSRDYQRLWFK